MCEDLDEPQLKDIVFLSILEAQLLWIIPELSMFVGPPGNWQSETQSGAGCGWERRSTSWEDLKFGTLDIAHLGIPSGYVKIAIEHGHL